MDFLLNILRTSTFRILARIGIFVDCINYDSSRDFKVRFLMRIMMKNLNTTPQHSSNLTRFFSSCETRRVFGCAERVLEVNFDDQT